MTNQLVNFNPAHWDEPLVPDHVLPAYSNPRIESVGGYAPITPELTRVSNADFVAAVFQGVPEGASAVVCSKSGDPSNGGWPAVPFDRLRGILPIGQNNYLNCASFRPDPEGMIKARKDNFAATHFLMLDDIGTKVPFARLGEFEPSWAIESSPDNHQVGIILDSPITDQGQLTQLLNAIIGAGLCDPGATGPATRWARLPQAINGKPKYRSESGQAFQCRLVRWAPDRRYTVQQVLDGLGLPPLAKPNTTQRLTPPPSAPLDEEGQQRIMVELKELLNVLDPDCGYRDWLNVLMGIYHSTNGSDDGFALANEWSSRSDKYKGPKELEAKWRSFNGGTQNPVTIRTIRTMAANLKKGETLSAPAATSSDNEFEQCAVVKSMPSDDGFEQCETTVVSVMQPPQPIPKVALHPLGKYSISDDIETLERQMVEQVPLLGNIALMGQATALFAAPNTGKTLLTLRLLTDAIERKVLDPKKMFYLNMDDNSVGLLEKAKIASEYGFEMLADGYKGFQSSDFRQAMESMIETDTAHGVAVVIDTLKKFTDTMDKGRSSDFSKVIRRFCLHGGTVIVLGHVNKNPGAGGKKVYAGTTDIVDDFDCAYILDTLSVQPQPGWKVVEFENIKRRGNVPESVAYRYKSAPGASYDAMLMSVEEEDYSSVLKLKDAAEVQNEMPIIDALRSGISEGATKMKLIAAVAQKVGLSRNIVGGVLDKYTGTDTAKHHWQFVVGARGAKTYALLGQDEQMAA
jgi:hypothetical protein